MNVRRGDFWNDDESSPEDELRGSANRQRVLAKLIAHALSTRSLDAQTVARWHKECFAGLSYVSASDQCLLGAYRGSAHPRLKKLRVGVGGTAGAEPHEVHAKLEDFFDQLERRMAGLASEIDSGKDKSPAELRKISEIAGWAHGEWVRIHPFANGSGRTARLIANWVLVRFRLLPVVGVRPRPGNPYGSCAAASMAGDHSGITKFIVDLLEDPDNRT